MKKFLITFGTLLSVALSGSADSVVIKGSDTLGAKLVPQLAEEFKAQHPGTAVRFRQRSLILCLVRC